MGQVKDSAVYIKRFLDFSSEAVYGSSFSWQKTSLTWRMWAVSSPYFYESRRRSAGMAHRTWIYIVCLGANWFFMRSTWEYLAFQVSDKCLYVHTYINATHIYKQCMSVLFDSQVRQNASKDATPFFLSFFLFFVIFFHIWLILF